MRAAIFMQPLMVLLLFSQQGASAGERSTARCVYFDGDSTVAVVRTVEGLRSLDGLSAFTFEAWIRPRTQGGGGRGRILQQMDGYINWYLSDDTRFGFRAGGKSGWRLSGKGAVRYWEWQHIAVTSDGIRLRFFVNGEMVGSLRRHITLDATHGDLWIGNGVGSDGQSRGFDGSIDELRISDSCLYTSDFGPPIPRTFDYDSTTVMLFHFDEDPTSPLALDATTYNAEIVLDDPIRGTAHSPRRVSAP